MAPVPGPSAWLRFADAATAASRSAGSTNVDSLGLRLPSDAQYRIPQVATRPDFYYRGSNAAIYIDGPPHDAPDQIRKDDGITNALNEFGYIVIRFHHAAEWSTVFRRHPDVFGVSIHPP